MACLKPKIGLLFALYIGVSCMGCVFNRSARLQVTVRDAETDVPIPRAKVDVATMLMAVGAYPGPASALADEDGIAILKAAMSRVQTWRVAANGYLPLNTMKKVDKPAPLVFRLYKKPAPHVIIIVPSGFHGPLKVELRTIPGWAQEKVGEREFIFHASATGFLRIDATPLLAKLEADIHRIDAQFEDGTEIPQGDYRIGPSAIGLRYMTGVGRRILFVIGTEQDVNSLHPLIYHYKNGDPHNVSHNFEAFNALFSEAPR
jgi:hypothetical protein